MTRTSEGTLRIASRGSRRARRQAEIGADLVRTSRPGVEVEVATVKTSGDRDQRPFAEIGSKGIFTSEVEREVVEGRADVAVHSAKDLTAELFDGCSIICVPPRAAAADVVVGGLGGSGEERLARLPERARVGTSSARRRALLGEARPDVDAVDFRGNIDTRLRKVQEGRVDAAILAAAGIERIAPSDADAAALDEERWVPAPAQGAIAVEARLDRDDIAELFVGLGDPHAAAEVTCERSYAAELEGGCSVPLGCRARSEHGRLVVVGFLATPDGVTTLRDKVSGPLEDAEALGRELARAILTAGGDDILAEVREEQAPRPAAP